jgi:hypothetical protein
VVTSKAACAYSNQQVFDDTAKVEMHTAVWVRYWVQAPSGLWACSTDFMSTELTVYSNS